MVLPTATEIVTGVALRLMTENDALLRMAGPSAEVESEPLISMPPLTVFASKRMPVVGF